MTIRNKKISQVRFDKTNVDAPTINRALDNVINPLNSWIDDATQAINNLQTNQNSGGGTITINPENAASITANNINLNGAGGISYASNGSDTITIYQQPISVAANGTAGTGTGNSITINGTSGITATRSGTTITLAGAATNITLNAQTGSITGATFNISGSGCCIHTETSGSDTLIISSSAICSLEGDGNITIATCSAGLDHTMLLAHFDVPTSTPPYFSDFGKAGFDNENFDTSHWVSNNNSPTFNNTNPKFGAGAVDLNGTPFTCMRFLGNTATYPYLQNANGTSGDFTFELWVKPASVAAASYTIAHIFDNSVGGNNGTGPVLGQINGNVWFAQGGLPANITAATLVAGVWQALAVSRSGNTTRVYLDGNLIGTYVGLDYGAGKDSVFLGQYAANTYAPGTFPGTIDEFRFSNVALYTGSTYQTQSAEFPNYSVVVDPCCRVIGLADNLSINSLTASVITSSQITSSAYTGSSATIGSITSNTFTGGTYTGSLATINTITASYYSGSNAEINSITASNISASTNIIAPAITGSEISSSNFIGWGNKIVRPYGAFCDLTTQTASATTTAYPMKFTTTEEALGVSIVNNSQITFAYAGTYNIQFSAQIAKNNASAADVDIWLRETGSNVPRSNTNLHIVGNNAANVAAWNFVRTFPSGSYAEIMWRTSDTNVELLYENSASNPDRPEIPSTILTISQV